jgi:hypothetical protein
MAASATNIQARYAGGWRTISSISAYYAGWRTITEVWVLYAGTWRHSWINSDPQTYNFYATWGMTYRSSGAQRGSTPLYQGYYSATYGQHVTLLGFDYASIQSYTAVRPAIDLVTLRLSSDHWWNGDYSATLGYTRHAGHNQASAPASFLPASLTWLWDDTFRGKEQAWSGGYAGARDQTKTITLPNPVGDELRDNNAKGLALWANSTGSDYYAYFWGSGASTSLKPYLSITCDYS